MRRPRALRDLRGHGGDGREDEPVAASDAPSARAPAGGWPSPSSTAATPAPRRTSAPATRPRPPRRPARATDRRGADELGAPALLLRPRVAPVSSRLISATNTAPFAPSWNVIRPPTESSPRAGPRSATIAGFSASVARASPARQLSGTGSSGSTRTPARRGRPRAPHRADPVAAQLKPEQRAGAGEAAHRPARPARLVAVVAQEQLLERRRLARQLRDADRGQRRSASSRRRGVDVEARPRCPRPGDRARPASAVEPVGRPRRARPSPRCASGGAARRACRSRPPARRG